MADQLRQNQSNEANGSAKASQGHAPQSPRPADAPQPVSHEVLDHVKQLGPDEQVQALQAIVHSVTMQGSLPSAIDNKVSEKHITDAIQGVRDREQHLYDLESKRLDQLGSDRNYALFVFLIVIALVIFLCVFFFSQTAVLEKLLAGLLGFGAGAMAGFGYGKSKS